ncbi:hypothetical protein LINGRAHAP2_LOCUS12828 [Linum grandiflorum]
MSSINESTFLYEDPPLSTAFLAIPASSSALFLLPSPSSPSSIANLTALSTSPLFTLTSVVSSFPPQNVGFSTPILTPIFITSTRNFSLLNWSPKSGHVTRGIPALIPSKEEFHPQCVRNPPTERWDNIET